MKLSLVACALLAVTGCAKPYGDADEDRSETALTEPAPAKAKKPTVATDAAESVTTNHDSNASADTKDDAKATDRSEPTVPSTLAFAWNEVSPTAEYSLDAMLKTGEMVGPCIGAPILGRELSLEGFSGKCTSAERVLPLDTIMDFRICYAENDDWAHCKCKLANWDGKSSAITFDNGS